MIQRDITPTQRMFIVSIALLRGRALTYRDVMRMTGCAKSTAYDVLDRVSTLLPVYEDDERYRLLPEFLEEFRREMKK